MKEYSLNRLQQLKKFFWRCLLASLLFCFFWWLINGGGEVGRFAENMIGYLVNRDYDLESAWEQVSRGIFPKSGLEGEAFEQVTSSYPDLPATGKVVRGFGWQKGRDGWPRFSEGIELEVSEGALVRAVLPGRVVMIGEDEILGKYLIIEHEGGCASLYGRLAEIGVQQDQEVVQGQAVASVRGKFFHFEVRQGDHLVDPLQSFQKES
ncbi:MAG TPA: hypothetical protein DCE07_09465 [Peptococcaceae bacterium]|nr:hypothetical protein [Peptococcaceae bacterium]